MRASKRFELIEMFELTVALERAKLLRHEPRRGRQSALQSLARQEKIVE